MVIVRSSVKVHYAMNCCCGTAGHLPELWLTRDPMYSVRISGREWHAVIPILVLTWIVLLVGLKAYSDDQVMHLFRRFNAPGRYLPRSDNTALGRCPGSIEVVLPHLHCGILYSQSCDEVQAPVL